MKWKLVLLLSLFGLGMGIAAVYLIPSNIEPLLTSNRGIIKKSSELLGRYRPNMKRYNPVAYLA